MKPDEDKLLIVGVNWIGDAIMTLPALARLRRERPGRVLRLLSKPGLLPLWRLFLPADALRVLPKGNAGVWQAVRELRTEACATAIVFPNSFRAALVPWLARIPRRRGARGHWRTALLTEIVPPAPNGVRRHQAWEYFDLLGLHVAPGAAGGPPPPPPAPEIPTEALARARSWLGAGQGPFVGLIPGAARGASKRWPAKHYIALGRLLVERLHATPAIMGARAETDLCAAVAAGIGPAAVSLAGRTSLAEWAALLRLCAAVACNDSGGMHLAAAVGTPLVAFYGLTDPAKTGPLARHAVILQKSDRRARDVARDDPAAVRALSAIAPEEAFEAVQRMMAAAEGNG